MTRCQPARVRRLCGIAVVVSVLGIVAQPARATVVFGNLGASGTNSIGSTNTDFGPDDNNELSLAQGFISGGSSQFLTVTSITLGLFFDSQNTANRTVSIFSDSSGAPGSAVFTSAAAAVGNTGTYTFNFSNATLAPNTPYWIVPQGPMSWYNNQAETQPTAQNSSGFSYLGSLRLNAPSPGSWGNTIQPLSVSVVAVPEPATVGLLAVAGLTGGFTLVRRRR